MMYFGAIQTIRTKLRPGTVATPLKSRTVREFLEGLDARWPDSRPRDKSMDSKGNPFLTLAAGTFPVRAFAAMRDAHTSTEVRDDVIQPDRRIGKGMPRGTQLLACNLWVGVSSGMWSDARDINITGYDILSLRIDKLGAPIDSAPITICSRPGLQTDPAVASDGTGFLAVWAGDFFA